MNKNRFMDTLPSEQLLIKRIKDGDLAAYDVIVSRYWDRTYARVIHLLNNRQDAEEVTQDAFIRAQRGLDSFRGEASFGTWLYQIATNLARNRYWYWFRRKRDQSFSIDQPLSADSDITLEDFMPSEQESPSESVITQEFVDRVAICMEDLSEQHREVLVLRNIENMSYDAIAARLGLSVGTVKSRIARGRERLRNLMGDDFEI
jgi:RNA polymerase sigma-70 factor (ECF subfamily)